MINASTGEDVFERKYVGQKTGIRKVSDGIILIAETKTEAIMKTDLEGNVLWTVDTEFDNRYNEVIQIIEENISYYYSFEEAADYDPNYVLSGDTAIVVSPEGIILESAKLVGENNYTYKGSSTITITQPSNNTSEPTSFGGYYYTTAALNIRSGPGTEYSVVRVLPARTEVYVTESETGSDGRIWAFIYKEGYVCADYLVPEGTGY